MFLCTASAQNDGRLDTATIERAIDDFNTAITERWAYRHASRVDFDSAISRLRKRARAGMSVDELGFELHKILAQGIDGHAGVRGYSLPSGRFLPFLIEGTGNRFVAFRPDRKAFLADGYPYIAKIDGKDVAKWCSAVAAIISKGAPQFIHNACLPRLRNIDGVRALMKLPQRDVVNVELVSKDGRLRRVLTLPTVSESPRYGFWPHRVSGEIENGVGYLRLVSMNKEDSVKVIKEWMPKFRNTRGLVIDVRDNDGGDRDALLHIYSYLAAHGDPPHVFTAAAYRLHGEHKENHLSKMHFMYRVDAKEWTDAERQAVAAFAKTFKPRMKLPVGRFSDLHYMALSRVDEPSTYHYDRPVMVLMNGKNVSATDIFLAGLKGMKNVTLLGTPSAGSSGFAQTIPLGTTTLSLRIASMASFQADGKLFDGIGVQPDVLIEPSSEYFIGGSDNLLAEAINRIGKM